MRDQPTGDQLLETARDLLRDELIAVLPANQRHGALMIANAMAIATRQLKFGDEPERQELAALRRILALPASDSSPTGSFPLEALVDCNRRLGRMLRQGEADSGSLHDEVWQHLVRTTRHRVAISNPKYLGGRA